MSLKRNQHSDEIDLTDLILIIWSRKWTLISIVLISLILMLIYLASQPDTKTFFKAKTEIRPISTFDAFKYEGYNSYLKNTTLGNVTYSTSEYDEDLEKVTNRNAFIFKDIDLYANVDNSSFKKIDKEYLINLFIDKLNENSIFIDAIKKFELIKRENYADDGAYENAIIKLSSSIDLVNSENEKNREVVMTIEFQTKDKQAWEEVLKYIEKNTNKEIQEYLNDTFNKLVLNQERLKKYKIEDIEILKSNISDNEKYVSDLDRLQKNLMENKTIERLSNAFQSTPIVKSNEFYAAKMMVESTKYQNVNSKSPNIIPMLILSIIIGGIIGLFYVLISNSIQGRKQ